VSSHRYYPFKTKKTHGGTWIIGIDKQKDWASLAFIDLGEKIPKSYTPRTTLVYSEINLSNPYTAWEYIGVMAKHILRNYTTSSKICLAGTALGALPRMLWASGYAEITCLEYSKAVCQLFQKFTEDYSPEFAKFLAANPVIQANANSWLVTAAEGKNRYDVIILDYEPLHPEAAFYDTDKLQAFYDSVFQLLSPGGSLLINYITMGESSSATILNICARICAQQGYRMDLSVTTGSSNCVIICSPVDKSPLSSKNPGLKKVVEKVSMLGTLSLLSESTLY